MIERETIGDCTLYLGDCHEILQTLGPVHAVLTDPPYGHQASSKGGLKARTSRSYDPKVVGHVWPAIIGDNRPFDPTPFLAYPSAVLWGANNYASRLPDSSCWFAWDRKVAKAADSHITDCELAWVKGLPFKTVRAFRHMWAGFQRDSEVGQKHVHPSQKPVALMEWCLQFFPNAAVILDPFMGSGSTGIACAKLGRRFIGIEIEPLYFERACQRIAEAVSRPSLPMKHD